MTYLLDAYDDEVYEQHDDGPVACDGCGEMFPESALYGNGLCEDCDDYEYARFVYGVERGEQ